ncbi:putative quinate O-hydroxycinnamoyltransferase [Dioscorea sansibarensis]
MAIENGSVTSSKETQVKVLNKTNVLPTTPLNKPSILLTTFDLPYITFYYNQKLLLYKCSEGDFDGIVTKLKDSLAVVLETFYPLAGRLAKDEDGVLVVECHGDSIIGAEVVEAMADTVLVQDLSEGDAASLLQDVVPYTGVMNLEGQHLPLLAIQFTKLKDGIAVGIAFNHAVVDGNSTWQFMTAWSEQCHMSSISPTLSPFHDRSKARSIKTKITLPTAAEHEKADPNSPQKPLTAKMFSFSSSAIDKLKAAANANISSNSISAFQSLGAHVWRAVCRARRLKPEDITVFAVFTDCRKRLNPPMPENYFGNLIQAIFTVTASGLLLSNPPEFGAELIHKVVNSHDNSAITARLGEYEEKPKMFYYSDAGINTVAVGSSPRFKVYDVDFGFGRPERVRSGSNNKFDGMMYLYPGRDGGRSIDVELTLDVEAMENLEKDEEFLLVNALA